MSDKTERMIATFRAHIEQQPDASYNLLGLAEMLLARKSGTRAMEIAREAMARGGDDPAVLMRGRQLLGSLLDGYHVPMMNDRRRAAAWDAALRRAVRPGMLVFDLGGGAGMLSLMAARAGATVVACEMSPISAQLAREIAEHNGLGERITVITGRSQDIQIGRDLPRRADMLITDIFGDLLFDFDPLPAIADARHRLLVPAAPVMPIAASIHAALACWDDYSRTGHIDAACDFDLSPFADFVSTAIRMPVDTPGLTLRSDAAELFRFDFAASRHLETDRAVRTCLVTETGEVNTIARWIRLELDSATMIEARPGPDPFFSGLTMTPLASPLRLNAGERISIGTSYRGKAVSTWIVPAMADDAF